MVCQLGVLRVGQVGHWGDARPGHHRRSPVTTPGAIEQGPWREQWSVVQQNRCDISFVQVVAQPHKPSEGGVGYKRSL
jgi:hypothetical protein